MAVRINFYRENIKPSINICRISVSILEENLRDIGGMLFELQGTKWLKSSGGENS